MGSSVYLAGFDVPRARMPQAGGWLYVVSLAFANLAEPASVCKRSSRPARLLVSKKNLDRQDPEREFSNRFKILEQVFKNAWTPALLPRSPARPCFGTMSLQKSAAIQRLCFRPFLPFLKTVGPTMLSRASGAYRLPSVASTSCSPLSRSCFSGPCSLWPPCWFVTSRRAR